MICCFVVFLCRRKQQEAIGSLVGDQRKEDQLIREWSVSSTSQRQSGDMICFKIGVCTNKKKEGMIKKRKKRRNQERQGKNKRASEGDRESGRIQGKEVQFQRRMIQEDFHHRFQCQERDSNASPESRSVS